MNRFRLTVEPLSHTAEPLHFEVENHDDIVAIAGKLPSRFGLDEDDTRALIIGFKLFGEIVLKHRKESPFSEIRSAMQEFGKALKQSGDGEQSHDTPVTPLNGER
jgi:hypothetical protein